MGEDVVVPESQSDGDPTGLDGTSQGSTVPFGPATATDPSDVLADPAVPTVPQPGTDTTSGAFPVETPPPEREDPFEPFLPGDPLLILVVLAVLGALALYAPGEIQRMRIESAFRESMDARLALARGDFALALAGFDRAIDQAHLAYTRRVRVGRPAEWTLLPDEFYIGLWRGRAQALRGLGRVRSAAVTTQLADELETVILGSTQAF